MRAGLALVVFAGSLAAQTTDSTPKGSIHGAVKDSTGAPAAGISVTWAMRADPGVVFLPQGIPVSVTNPLLPVETDESGAYTIAHLRAETYSVKIECAPDAKRIRLDGDQEATLDFQCPANPVIRGRVQVADEEPAVDAFVWLLKPEYQDGMLRQIVIGPKVTAEDGSFAFEAGLEPNRRYYVVVDQSPPEELMSAPPVDLKERAPIGVPTFYPSVARLDAAAPIVLQPGEKLDHVDIQLVTAPYYCVEGKITRGGAPASSSFAIADSALTGSRLVRLRGISGDDGKYHACGLSAGSYRLSTEDTFIEFAATESDVQHVDLAADPAHLTLTVDWDDPPTAKLDANGQKILRRLATLLGMGDNPSEADLNELVLRLRREAAENAEPFPTIRVPIEQEFTPEQLADFSRQLWPLPLMVNAVLTGVTNGVSGAFSAVAGRQLPLPDFRRDIPAGDYLVRIAERGTNVAYAKEVSYNGAKLTDDSLRVAPGANGTIGVIMSPSVATLTVKVNDAEGKPVPDATVIAIPQSVTSVTQLSRLANKGRTDQNGNYPQVLAPGKYKILAIDQPIRWGVPDDLEKVLLVLFQAKDVDLDPKSSVQVALVPIPL